MKRAPPAYQVYASDELASERYFGLSLSERGLMDAMRRACWVSDDGTIPADAAGLAVQVRRPEAEVNAALTPAVLRWFSPTADGARLGDSELARQRASIERIRKAQSDGARVGLEAIHEKGRKKRKRAARLHDPSDSGPVTGSVSSPVLNRNEMSRKERSLPDLSLVHDAGNDAVREVDLEQYLQEGARRNT